MARPTKTLQEHLRDGSFRADRHAGLLLGPLVDDPDLAGLQAIYRTAASTDEQRLVAIAFARESKLHEGRKLRAILNGRDGAAVADFFASNFVHTKGPAAGRAFDLEDWQRAFVDEFYKRDEEGRRIYRLGVLGVPRGNGKCPLAAGLGLYELLTRRDSPDVFCAAGSREQARIVFNFARSFVETGPLLDVVRVGRNELIYPDGTGSMRVVSADGSLQFGHSVSCAIVDEAHVFATQKHRTCGRRSRRPCTSGSTRSCSPSRRPGQTARACSDAWSSPRSPSSRSSAPTRASRSGATRRTACSSGGTPPRTRPSSTTRRPGARPTPQAGSTCAISAVSATHRGRPSQPSAACT